MTRLNSKFPLIAILRGILPQEIEPVCTKLIELGFEQIEIPLNSPEPYDSIMQLASLAPAHVMIGAGTVTEINQIELVKQAGGQFIVMPHADADIIRAVKSQNLICIPGFFTPTEAYQAIHAGADALKWFPAGQENPAFLTAIKTILPKNIFIYAVGGIHLDNMALYKKAGADGFGLGTVLFKPGMKIEEIEKSAKQYIHCVKQLMER